MIGFTGTLMCSLTCGGGRVDDGSGEGGDGAGDRVRDLRGGEIGGVDGQDAVAEPFQVGDRLLVEADLPLSAGGVGLEPVAGAVGEAAQDRVGQREQDHRQVRHIDTGVHRQKVLNWHTVGALEDQGGGETAVEQDGPPGRQNRPYLRLQLVQPVRGDSQGEGPAPHGLGDGADRLSERCRRGLLRTISRGWRTSPGGRTS